MNRMKVINILFAFFITLIFARSSYSNVPIGGAVAMTLPFVSLIPSWGFALVVVIFIEMLILKKHLDLQYLEASKISIFVNLLSTLIGAGIFIAYTSSFAFLICWIPGAIFLKKCFISLSDKTGYLQDFAKKKILTFFVFLSIGFIGFLFGALLTPGIFELPVSQVFSKSISVISFIILLFLGFIITLIMEGYILVKHKSQKSDKVIPTILSMNAISYAVLLPFFIFYFWNILLDFKTLKIF